MNRIISAVLLLLGLMPYLNGRPVLIVFHKGGENSAAAAGLCGTEILFVSFF